MAVKTYLQAISDGLRQEMQRDKRVYVIGEDVRAVDDDAVEPVRLRAVGEVLACVLEVCRRRVGPLVVVTNEDDGEAARAGEVHRLVALAIGGGALAEEGHRHSGLASHLEREG